MKKTLAIVCIAAWVATPGFTQDPSKKSTEDLVKAAASTKSKRKKSATKVITNKDVKKSKGKIAVLPPSTREADKPDATSSLVKQNNDFHARQKAMERLETAQKHVDALEKELALIEQRYYEENDANYRDKVLQDRFNQTRRQLENARRDLADARDAFPGNAPQVTTTAQ